MIMRTAMLGFIYATFAENGSYYPLRLCESHLRDGPHVSLEKRKSMPSFPFASRILEHLTFFRWFFGL